TLDLMRTKRHWELVLGDYIPRAGTRATLETLFFIVFPPMSLTSALEREGLRQILHIRHQVADVTASPHPPKLSTEQIRIEWEKELLSVEGARDMQSDTGSNRIQSHTRSEPG